jgi:hypothetical protein
VPGTATRARPRAHPAGGRTSGYDYAGQDPINNYDLNGQCVWYEGNRRCLNDNYPSQDKRPGGGSSGGVALAVYFTDYALGRMAQRGITEDDVNQTLSGSSGRYEGFKYRVVRGVTRYGFWFRGTFVATEVDSQGDIVVVNVLKGVSREAVDAMIKAGKSIP